MAMIIFIFVKNNVIDRQRGNSTNNSLSFFKSLSAPRIGNVVRNWGGKAASLMTPWTRWEYVLRGEKKILATPSFSSLSAIFDDLFLLTDLSQRAQQVRHVRMGGRQPSTTSWRIQGQAGSMSRPRGEKSMKKDTKGRWSLLRYRQWFLWWAAIGI